MEKREIVKRALNFDKIPYTPWHFKFTKEAKDKLLEYLNGADLEDYLQNHFLDLGSDYGLFEYLGNDLYQDNFGVVWDRSVDKDIGVMKELYFQNLHWMVINSLIHVINYFLTIFRTRLINMVVDFVYTPSDFLSLRGLGA